MGTDALAANTSMLGGTHAKLPKRVAVPSPDEMSTKLQNEADTAAAINPDTKLPKLRFSATERLRRLEEAMAFLRQHLAAGPQPARTLLNAAYAAGIAERTLHRAKDLLGVTTERAGGYAARGQWIWSPPTATVTLSKPASERGVPALASRRH